MLLIVDANVLIDYTNTDLSILTLAARHIGPIHVPSVVLDEVGTLDVPTCESLGLMVVDEPLDVLLAASETGGALSFQDQVCLSLAKSNAWVCVTNDKPLRRACEREGVTPMWGLRLMIELVDRGALEAGQAYAIAADIHESNPRHITPAILERFRAEVGLPALVKPHKP